MVTRSTTDGTVAGKPRVEEERLAQLHGSHGKWVLGRDQRIWRPYGQLKRKGCIQYVNVQSGVLAASDQQQDPTDAERAIGRNCAELIEDGATLQMGIGAIPNAVLAALIDHRDLGIHTADDLAAVQAQLNQRPRKVLAWDNPADQMATLLRTPVLRR